MKASLKRFILVLAGTLLLAGCCTSHHAARQWEYKVVRNEAYQANLGDPALDPKLTELGREGWELVSWNKDAWVFKRPAK